MQLVTFYIEGEGQYVRGFEAMAEATADMRVPLERIGESLRVSVSEQFRTEGDQGAHGKWQPLNPSYEAWKRQQVGDEPILVFTGQTRQAMTDRGAITVGPRRMVYEPAVPDYAPKHQRGEGRLPQRRMVDLPGPTRRGWDRIFAEWINDVRHGRLPGG